MAHFFRRLVSKMLGQSTLQPEVAAYLQGSTAAPDQLPEAEKDAVIQALGPRRPLIAADGSIAGFEFCIDSAVLARLVQRPDHRGWSAQVARVLTSARLTAHTGRVGFARLPMNWLVYAVEADLCPGVWIGLDPTVGEPDQFVLSPEVTYAVKTLRASGVQVGWDMSVMSLVRRDFLLLHQGQQPIGQLLKGRSSWPGELRRLDILMTDIGSLENLEMALEQGVKFACGALAPMAGSPDHEVREFLPVPPEMQRVAVLLNQLVTGTETGAIVSSIKGDVGISLRLLKRINNASYAQLMPDSDIEHAVMLLGRNELYRWLSMLLVQFAGHRKASSALQEITLWRARLLELLALECHEDKPGQFFTLGLASMLSVLLKISPQDVVTMLNLPEPARLALLEQTGPWADYLRILERVERQQLEDSDAPVSRWGDATQVLALSDQAWAWASAQNKS
ncbi:MAG: signal transduction protein [Comamonadaceae bacterium]|nr:MAG: signal transduction protein [Comamonadaceae bacterium]